jgi:hypothetical protein
MQTLLRGQFSNLYAPEDKVIGGPQGGGVESIVDFLNEEDVDDKKEDLLADDKEDDEEEEAPKKGGKKDKEADEADEDEEKIGDKEEEKELELEDDEEPDEEELELITPVSRKAILKKYPTIFKDFPYIEKAIYREQAYTELLPTIEDAKEVVERVKNFDRFEQEVLSGSSESLLKTVKDTDPAAFNKIVDNYLGNLQKVDQPAYFHVVGNVVKSTILSMAREARASQNDNLLGAAQILNQFVFGGSDFVPPTNLSGEPNKEVDSEKNRLQAERAEYMKERFESSLEDLSGRVKNILKSTITQHIDPSNDMTDYVKKNAVKDALENLEELIEADSRFGTMKDKLWMKAVESNFNQKSLNAIRNAYLSKSKSLLKSVIQKSRNDALKGQGKRSKNDRDDVDTRPRTSQSRSANREESDRDRNDTRPLKKGEIPRGMSNRDFIMSD